MTTTQDLSFPNRVVRPFTERGSFDRQVMNLVPRIGFLRSSPQFPKGNIFFDLDTNTLYYSTGNRWIPIANAASFKTTTDMECFPITGDIIVVIEPSSFIVGDDVSVALVPRGIGGVSLSAPDLTPTGGNCRGTSAVDLQIKRTTAAQIASGTSSIILGGKDNTAGGDLSVAAGESATAGGVNSMCFSCNPAGATASIDSEFKIGLPVAAPLAGRLTIDNLPAFADDAAAGAGPVVLSTGMLYQTDGTAAAPLNVAGIMMMKQ